MGTVTVAESAGAAVIPNQTTDVANLRSWRDVDENLKNGTDVRRDLKWGGYERK